MERTLTVDAVQQLRRDLNVGACQHIYDSGAQFFRFQTFEDWRAECEYLRDTLGTWLTFDASRAEGYAQNNIRIILMEGLGGFQNGGKRLSVSWIVGNGQVELREIRVALDPNHWVSAPSRIRPSFIDPPMFRAPPYRKAGMPRGRFTVAGSRGVLPGAWS